MAETPPKMQTIWHLEVKQPNKHHYYGSLTTLFAFHPNLDVSYSKVSKETAGIEYYEIETENFIIRKGKKLTISGSST